MKCIITIFLQFVVSSVSLRMKRVVRKDIGNKLKELSKEYIDEQSSMVVTKLLDLPQFKSCNALSVYLSMGGEINTNEILHKSFEFNRRVFIPKITGKKSEDMFMLEVSGLDTINSFAKNNWGIPEPSKDIIESSKDGTYSGEIDLVLLPGVAFDKNCNRLGHGKGYYGKINYINHALLY